MRYLGSKARHAKEIIEVILKDSGRTEGLWVEPFVGGGNLIDKVPKTFTRIGYDVNPHSIQALIAIRDHVESLPETVSEIGYKLNKGKPPSPVSSWIRFAASFGGKFEGGFARDKTGKRNLCAEQKRNALKQSVEIQGVGLHTSSFLDLNIKNAIIYCDPPYQNTTGYSTNSFCHEVFFGWCREMKSKGNIVYVSEYSCPSDFTEIWQKKVTVCVNSGRDSAPTNVERLFKV